MEVVSVESEQAEPAGDAPADAPAAVDAPADAPATGDAQADSFEEPEEKKVVTFALDQPQPPVAVQMNAGMGNKGKPMLVVPRDLAAGE